MGAIFLVGPTAVGKSAVALELAGRIKAEIVSADSMQVYRGMDIGTAKPTDLERQAVPHHLIDVCEPSDIFDVKRFVELAEEVLVRVPYALVVGGTGLYIRALRQGLFDGPGRDPQLRDRLEALSVDKLFAELQHADPVTAAKIDRHNPRRLIRALEVFYLTGKPIKNLQSQWNQLPLTECQAPCFCLTRDRQDLIERIEKRIDRQIADGWVEEVRDLMARGLFKNPTAMQAAGYRELAAHLRGELSLSEAIHLIKIRTRQLAKRQMTWFRREPGLTWLAVERDEKPAITAERIVEAGKLT